MVQLAKYLRSSGLDDPGPLPLLNSLFIETTSIWDTIGNDNAFKQFMMWARRSPQLMGLLNVIATDILSDDISFDPLDKDGKSGRNRKIRAKEFWEANNGYDVVEATIYDLLICGIGYNWVGKLDKNLIRAAARSTVEGVYGESQEREFLEFRAEQLYEAVASGEVSSLAKKFRHIPASTVSIKSDEHEILAYVQRVGVRHKIFSPDEVIAVRLMPLDGKPYPFAPVEAILAEIYLIWLISQNYISYFENGGHPDKVFVLPKEIAGSRNHEYLIKTLQKYKRIQNKHGNLVFTGELTIEDLMKFESQMEHKELGLYVVGVMAMLYGIPVSRIPFLLGKAASSGDSGGLADTGYWRKISVWQAKFERAYNPCLFNPYFGVNITFARGYKQDEVREVQVELDKTYVAQARIDLGVWTEEQAGRYLGIDPDQVHEALKRKEERRGEEMNMQLSQQRDRKENLLREPDAKLKAKRKQETQLTHQTNAGGKKINP